MASPIHTDGPTRIVFRALERTTPAEEPADASFGDLFRRVINDTSGLQDDARATIEAFLRGEPVELHQVMAASEEASIALELLVEIRNKLTDAYRTVMNVQ
jgi:flagellar hook-basal body complex protein FliE